MNGANLGAISDSAIVRSSSTRELQGRWEWCEVVSDDCVVAGRDKPLSINLSNEMR